MGEQPFGRVRLIEMVVESVRVHMLSSQHVVILKESERDRYLPIWIGPAEANAIAMRLQGLTAERPLTHDLLVSVVSGLAASVDRVVITHVVDGTFHARLYLETTDGSETEIDSRTSDAIAVAVRTGPLQNLRLAIERCHLTIARQLYAPYASGLATLDPDELSLGCTLIDMGAGCTSIAGVKPIVCRRRVVSWRCATATAFGSMARSSASFALSAAIWLETPAEVPGDGVATSWPMMSQAPMEP